MSFSTGCSAVLGSTRTAPDGTDGGSAAVGGSASACRPLRDAVDWHILRRTAIAPCRDCLCRLEAQRVQEGALAAAEAMVLSMQ